MIAALSAYAFAASNVLSTPAVSANEQDSEQTSELEPALIWALEEGLLDDASLWDEPVTIGQLSIMMYRQCPDQYYETMDISQLMTNYPELPEEGIRALIWSMDHKIVLGTGEVDSTMTLYNNSIKRATLALYLQRFHAASNYEG